MPTHLRRICPIFRLRRHALALAACHVLATPAAQALVTFDVTDLGAFNPLGAGVGSSIATGINNSGVVVGNFYDGSVGNPARPWYLPTQVAGLSTWRKLITAGLLNQNPNLPLPAEVVGISNNGLLVGNGLLADGKVHPLSWSLNVNGFTDVPTVFDALRGNVGCGSGCEPYVMPYRALAVNNQHVLLAHTLDGSRALYYPGVLTTVWEPTQAYNGIPAPVVLNDAGTRVGSPFTGLNNAGQRVGSGPSGNPVLTWLVPDAFGNPGASTQQIDLNSMLSAGSNTSVSRVTGINDLGQIVGQGTNGQAVLLTPAGSVNYKLAGGPFGGGAASWDTPLDMLPTALLSIVIAPVGGGFISGGNANDPSDPIGQLSGQTVRRLTLGKPLSPGGGSPSGFYDMDLMLRLTATDKVAVGPNVLLRLRDGSAIQAQAGMDNQGHVSVSGGSITGRFDNQLSAELSVSGGSFQVHGDLRNAFCNGQGCQAGGGSVQVADQAGLLVDGSVLNTGRFAVDSGGRLSARSFSQTAGQLTVDGTLDTFGGDVVISGGSLNGNGTINAGVLLADGSRDGRFQVGGGPGFAFFRPGHSPGSVTIHGQLVIAARGELELQVERLADGSLAWDQVNASSVRVLDGGKVHVVIGAGVATDQLQTLSFLGCGAGCNFADGTAFVIDGAAGAQYQFGAGGFTLNLPPAQAVPEPAAATLLLAGLLVLPGQARSKRSRSITLTQAATKSRTKAACPSLLP